MSAADRVEAFLGVWDRPGGLRDDVVIYTVNETDLRIDDLRELIAAYRAQHPTGTPTADHRIIAEQLAGDRPASGAGASWAPLGTSAASFTASIAHALDAAHDAGYDAGCRDSLDGASS